ncbi:hypothetical protein RUM43_006707 [Polyplax serrata]|uniref:RIB43A-like with coiled-coils protein 2 n=1 Tax=Polyplax serrata TaxID=468196 RepID=A0AAN8RVK9_POLSC
MLNSLKPDEKEACRLMRRKENLEKVKARLLNNRLRVFGVDVETWKKQEEEKKKIKEEEERKDLEYHKQKLKEDLICVIAEKKLQDEKKEILKKVQEFRQNYQRFEDRREYDLNDPLYKKRALPIRISDDDPRCTISSAQKFEGEDLRREERLRIQGEQTRAWLEQQMAAKKEEEEEKEKAEQIYMEALVSRDKRAVELAKLEEECNKKLQQSTAEFNRILASEKEVRERSRRLKDDMDKEAEKTNWINSDLLTENPEVAASSLGPQKMIGYLFKGGGADKAKEIAKFLEKQREEKKKRQTDEASIQKEWDTLVQKMDRHMYFKEKELMEQQRPVRLNAQMLEMNKKLAREKQERDEYLKKYVYTNIPTEEYYNQFNTSLY